MIAAAGGSDSRVELAGTSTIDLATAANVVVVLGNDVASDAQVVADARRLALALGGQVFAADRSPIAPELCIAIGASPSDVASSSRLVQIGPPRAQQADGVLAGSPGAGLADLIHRLGTV
jgi:hypothetical protein